MKMLLLMWCSSLLTFTVVASMILTRQEEINVPGELGEAISATGVTVFAVLLLITAIWVFVGALRKQ